MSLKVPGIFFTLFGFPACFLSLVIPEVCLILLGTENIFNLLKSRSNFQLSRVP